MNRLKELHEAGVSIWLDTLSRPLLDGGEFAQLVIDDSVTGATSNPTIFAAALTGSEQYDEQLRVIAANGVSDLREMFFELALDDIRHAARILRPVHDASGGADGYISFECTPEIVDDAPATIEQASELWSRLDLANAMIKVPATEAGVVAIEELIARGVNVNVTLLFAIDRYEQVIEAYFSGLERRVQAGHSIDRIASAASFFVSRVDTKVDAQLDASSALRGRVAIANAQLAYGRYSQRFVGERWQRLQRLGAKAQRLLWASTATKNPAYSDVLYIEQLIAPGVINTMPEQTLRAFADHGQVRSTLDAETTEARRVLAELALAGVDLARITRELEREGVQSFCASYRELLSCIESKVKG